MNARETVRRLRAWDKGKPLPRGSTLHLKVAEDNDILIVVFLRMGGESRPWGIAYGSPGSAPEMFTIPDARRRDDVAAICASFAPTLLAHLRVPAFAGADVSAKEDLAPIRQVWVPNAAHLEMLHHLNYTYTFTTFGGASQPLLNALGRGSGWLFRESQRPGQQHVCVATAALRSAYTFPAEDARQGHLGYLLAWLDTPGERQKRLRAATDAERRSISTSLDPEIERDSLEALVSAWGEADRGGNDRISKRSAAEIAAILSAELRRRFDLTADAVRHLRADPRRENSGVSILVDAGLEEQWKQHLQVELRLSGDEDGPAFVPSPETDRHPAAAAARYLVHEASAELVESVLLRDDTELLAEAISRGDAIAGEVVSVWDEGIAPKTAPVWVVDAPWSGQLRLRTGSRVCMIDLPNRTFYIRAIEDGEDGGRRFELGVDGCITKPRQATGRFVVLAADTRWIGQKVSLVKTSADGISRQKSRLVWKRDGPGAWLTHARPAGARARVRGDDDAPDADDVTAVVTAEGAA